MEDSDQRPTGLYRSSDEHDACGVGFVAHIKGVRSHAIVRDALDLLINLEHRGAAGSDPDTGDGAGILVQMPDRFLRQAVTFALPPPGAYGAGLVFLPTDEPLRARPARAGRAHRRRGGPDRARLATGADQPVGHRQERRCRRPGVRAAVHRPRRRSRWRGRRHAIRAPLFVIRKRIEHAVDQMPLPDEHRRSFYIVSLSARTLIYKGMLTASQLGGMFPDLLDDPRSSRHWRSCTSASRPTRFRRGRWRTPTGSWRTTARSTRCAATSTGCARARGCCSRTCSATTSRRSCR